MKTKICAKCGEEKPETVEYFYRQKGCSGGLHSQCKLCIKAYKSRWYKENTEKSNKKSKKWSKENPEKVSEWNKRWREDNTEKCIEAQKKWREANPEKVRESWKKWREANPEKVRESWKKWYKRTHIKDSLM